MKNTFAGIILVMLLLLAVAPLSAEKPQLRFVTSVEHWLGLRHVLEPGDMVVSLAAVQQPQGAFGRERGTPPWRETQLGREMFALDRVDREGIVKGIVFRPRGLPPQPGAHPALRLLDLLPDLRGNHAPGRPDRSPHLGRTVRPGRPRGRLEGHVGARRGDDRPQPGELLKLAQFVDGLQISLPALAGSRDSLAFAREARRRIDLVRGFNSNCQVALDIGPEILTEGPATRALLDLAGSVDVISLWAVKDGESTLRLIQRLRSG